jgi:hypothetical protein
LLQGVKIFLNDGGRATAPLYFRRKNMLPFKTIELDKSYEVRFTMGAIEEFEEMTGRGILDAAYNYASTAKLLWVALKQKNPSLTLEQTRKLIDEHAKSINYVRDIILEALVLSLSGKTKEERRAESDPNALAPAAKEQES